MPKFEVTIKRKVIYKAKITIDAEDESAATEIVESELPVFDSPNSLSISYEVVLDEEEVDDVVNLDSN